MKAIVYEGPEQLVEKELPEPEPKDGEVKLKVRACGICGSDVHGYLGSTGRRIPPMVMGHEFCGEVVKRGKGATRFPLGMRVSVYPVDFCGTCEMCKKGDVHLCLHKKAYGVLDVNGAFAEYICVPEKCCFPIADDVSDAVASLMEPLAVAYRGVSHAGTLAGKTVLLVGTGTIGLLALACVKKEKPEKIIVSDLSDSRLKLAKKMGADAIINPEKEDFHKRILEESAGLGVDVAIEAVGVEATVQQAMSALRFGGKAVWIGNNKPFISINMQEVVTRELSVYGSFLYGYEEFQKVVQSINEGSIQVEPLISATISLNNVPKYFETLAHSPGNLIKVIVVNSEGETK